MFGAPINNGLTFTKVLGGISKTLNVANQIIPLYREAKPMINNAKNILSVLKGINKGNSTSVKSNNNSTNKKDTVIEAPVVNTNNPSFFL